MKVISNCSHFTERSSQVRTPSVLDYIRLSQGRCDLTLADGSSFVSSSQLSKLKLNGNDLLAGLKYGNIQGYEPLREVLSGRHGTDPNEIVLTSGASEAIFLVLGCIVENGIKVLVPRPAFPAYEAAVRFWGGEVEAYELRSQDKYSMEPLIEKISHRTSALIVNSPHNPTGACIPRSVFREVLNKADKYGCWVLSDEVYDHFHFDGSTHNSLFDVIEPQAATRHVIVQSFSKRQNLPGIRVGYAITHNSLLIDKILDIKTHYSMGTSIIAQQIALKAMKLEPEVSLTLAQVTEKHRNLLVQAIGQSGVPFVLPQGGFYVMLNDPEIAHDESILFKHFQSLGVMGLPGSVFNSPEPSLRLCLLVPTIRIEAACELIAESHWPNKI